MTKEYLFTEHEILVLREALIEYWHNVSKHVEPTSPAAQRHHNLVRPLIDQFRADAARA